MEARRADIDIFLLDAFFGERLLQGFENDRFARGIGGAFETERFDDKTFELQSAGFVRLELRELEAARPKINRQK